MAPLTPLLNSERPRPASSNLVCACDPDYSVHFNIVVRRRPEAPKIPDLNDWQKTPWHQRSIISPEEYGTKFGASQADMAAVAVYVRQHNIQVLDQHPGTRCISVIATASQVYDAFKVRLNKYATSFPARLGPKRGESAKPHEHHGFDGQVHVPEHLQEVIVAFMGLDNRSFTNGAPGVDPVSSTGASAGFISVQKAKDLYKFPTTDATDQTIGIISCTGGYLQSDMDAYFTGVVKPSIVDISLFADGVTFTNNNSKISTITNANKNNFGPQIETTFDIQVAGTAAPGCTINMYFTTNTEMGWHVFLNRILQPQAGEKSPTMVSCSWTLELWDDAPNRSGTGPSGKTNFQVLSELFQDLAFLGINVFTDTGDWGSDDIASDSTLTSDTKAHVGYPSSDPWVTAVGGTIIVEDAADPKGFVENAWSDLTGGNFPGATGGGCSNLFGTQPPPYQTAAGINQRLSHSVDSSGNPTGSTTTVSGRFTPDIASMQAFNSLHLNGVDWFNDGTSFSTPLMAGLFAVLRSSFGRSFGHLNSLIYPLGNVADSPFNNVTVGDNRTGRNAPFFNADDSPGLGGTFDPVTGWGSINGIQMQDKLAAQLYPRGAYFAIAKNSFTKAEVGSGATFPDAFWIVVEGVAASENLGIATVASSLFSSGSGISVSVGPRVLETKIDENVPQRILYPCTVKFTSAAVAHFPASGSAPTITTMTGRLVIPTLPVPHTVFSCLGEIQLISAADPYFQNIASDGSTPWWLSQDLRVFTATPGVNRTPISVTGIPGAPSLNPSTLQSTDSSAGYQYCQQLLTWMSNNFSDPEGIDPLDLLPNQSNEATAASSVTPTSFDSSTGGLFANYSFAIARVRISQSTGSEAVKVFFRLFTSQTADTDYSPGVAYQTVSGSPVVGLFETTIPFFATGNYDSNNDYSGTSVNNKTVTVSTSGGKWVYFGCFINIYDLNNKVNTLPVQSILKAGHHCLVAEISYADTPIVSPPGQNASPSNSDKLAQRNLELIYSDNPGGIETHLVPQILNIRPSLPWSLSPKVSQGRPDELQIQWNNTEPGSTASLYWPTVDLSNVIKLSKSLYATNQLSMSQAEPHTLSITVPPEGQTYIPIPFSQTLDETKAENIPTLLAIQLPQGIVQGQEFIITVRRWRTRESQVIRLTHPTAEEVETPTEGYRYITSSFTLRIPVSIPREILPLDRDIQSITAWRLNQTPPKNAWFKVLQRYLRYINARVNGLAGQELPIVPSPIGVAGSCPGYGSGGYCREGEDGPKGHCGCRCHWHRRGHGRACHGCGCFEWEGRRKKCECSCHVVVKDCGECQCEK